MVRLRSRGEDPQTKLFVTMLAGVLEFQRDMISENTKEGVAAAEAADRTLGRPAALDGDQAAEAANAYRAGAAVKALARQHGVAPKTIRRVLDAAGARDVGDVLEELDGVACQVEDQEQAPERPHTIDVPACSPNTFRACGTPPSTRRCAAAGSFAAGRATRCALPLRLRSMSPR
ncbi:recombinase family protein [Streptomyces sp. NBC_00289]|uniref:recombinase family protein n=1 Tax=Streptomyces sp. NBC_00289 TaxID=2975703 RepID=UPI00324B2A63